jgi:hypothetical protein
MSDTLAIEHAIQRQMIERLGIDWTPGEPFYALVEDEIVRLRAALLRIEEIVSRPGLDDPRSLIWAEAIHALARGRSC